VRRTLQDFILPLRYFRHRVKGMPAVPAYFWHQVEAASFQPICEWLIGAGFRTVTFGELLDGRATHDHCVAITLDDGWSSAWSVAFPLARRYSMRFTLFATAELMEKSEECRPTLDDGVEASSLVARDFGARPMLTWGEVRAMHESGIVDVQSHSLTHGVVFNGNRLSGFCTPTGPFPLNGHTPLITRMNGRDVPEWHPALGTPLYEWGPALATERRFLVSPNTSARCVQVVESQGGAEFFRTKEWRQVLCKIIDEAEAGCWETEDERRERYRKDLTQAKSMIEEMLPGHVVRAFAPPWGAMHHDLSRIALETGHELMVLAYPSPSAFSSTPLPLYPRLFGSAIWTFIRGPLLGGIHCWCASRYSRARHEAGAVP
jgi:hypothetical protein